MLPPPSSDEERRRAVAWAVAVTADTPLAPKRYERQLLDRYQRGELTIEQVIQLLDTSVYQVLYRSRAVHPFTEEQLLDLIGARPRLQRAAPNHGAAALRRRPVRASIGRV